MVVPDPAPHVATYQHNTQPNKHKTNTNMETTSNTHNSTQTTPNPHTLPLQSPPTKYPLTLHISIANIINITINFPFQSHANCSISHSCILLYFSTPFCHSLLTFITIQSTASNTSKILKLFCVTAASTS